MTKIMIGGTEATIGGTAQLTISCTPIGTQAVDTEKNMTTAANRVIDFAAGEAIGGYSNSHLRIVGFLLKNLGKSLERLKCGELIYITGRATNKYTKKTFSVNFEALERAKAEVVNRSKGEKESVREANARADREAYYAHLQAAEEARAERMNARARADDKYLLAEREYKRLDFEIAKAEVYHLPTLADLQRKQREAGERRAKRLEALNLSELDLLPKRRCQKCNDTGFLLNGKACDCYPERGRR